MTGEPILPGRISWIVERIHILEKEVPYMTQRNPMNPSGGELSTPSFPDLNQPAMPGVGPEGLPTPSLPSTPQPSRPQPSQPSCPSTGCPPIVQRCPTGYQRQTVRSNQSFTDLLLENNVSYSAMRAANPNLSTSRPPAGTVYCAPPSGTRRMCAFGSRTYVMGQGETLYSLVRTLNTTATQLLRANPELAPGDFLPGRVICLP